jgi:carboxylesterase type B
MIMVDALAVVLLILLIIPITKATNIAPTAQTQQGVYIGRQITINGTNVNYWYGIPYAQQPIGNLRWMPPRALAISNGTKDAYIPNGCAQRDDYGFLRTEACLTLNVYSPENASNLPVFVWIHGGGFVSGAGILYNATPFVSTSIINSVPVVIVTINYRLGLFGFLADEALYDEKSGINNRSTTGNYGILDQIVALDWIKKNIVGFGGNPEQITVGGQSGGGISVTILLTSSLVAAGTFQRAIVQSGTIWPNLVGILETAINNTGHFLRAITNCTTVQCFRNLTVDQIHTVESILAPKSFFGLYAFPVIDGYVLNDILENSYARGNFQKVPILIGSTANETSLFTCPFFNYTADSVQVQTFFKTVYNATVIDAIPTIYGPISAYNNPLTYLNIVYTDSWMHCGSRRIASKFSTYGLSSYLYTYDHAITLPSPCFGVIHNAELPMLFPSLHLFNLNYSFTPLEQQLSTNMILYWANFIHTSNPNFPGSLANWDAYVNTSDNDFVLDILPHMRNYYYNTSCSDLWDSYAVANSTFTSVANTYTNTYQYFYCFFLLFPFVSILI